MTVTEKLWGVHLSHVGVSNGLSEICPVSPYLSVVGFGFLGHLIPFWELVFLTGELLFIETQKGLPRSTCLEIRLRITPSIRRELDTRDTSIRKPVSLLHTFWLWCISLFTIHKSRRLRGFTKFVFLNLPLARKLIQAIRILRLQFKLYHPTVTSDAAEIEDRFGC